MLLESFLPLGLQGRVSTETEIQFSYPFLVLSRTSQWLDLAHRPLLSWETWSMLDSNNGAPSQTTFLWNQDSRYKQPTQNLQTTLVACWVVAKRASHSSRFWPWPKVTCLQPMVKTVKTHPTLEMAINTLSSGKCARRFKDKSTKWWRDMWMPEMVRSILLLMKLTTFRRWETSIQVQTMVKLLMECWKLIGQCLIWLWARKPPILVGITSIQEPKLPFSVVPM